MNPIKVVSRTEAVAIRSKLRLRFNTLSNHYEVYTTIHGSGIFSWHAVTDHIANWYKEHFGLHVESYLQPSLRTGGLIEVSSHGKRVTPETDEKDTPSS